MIESKKLAAVSESEKWGNVYLWIHRGLAVITFISLLGVLDGTSIKSPDQLMKSIEDLAPLLTLAIATPLLANGYAHLWKGKFVSTKAR